MQLGVKEEEPRGWERRGGARRAGLEESGRGRKLWGHGCSQRKTKTWGGAGLERPREWVTAGGLDKKP